MAETVKGNKLVYLFRRYNQRTSEAGDLFAFVTDNSRSVSKDAETTETKDGMVRTPGEAEVTISSTSILKKGDTRISAFEQAMLDGELIESWEANLEDPKEYVYELTSDTDIVSGKTYYTRSGSSPNYTYSEVASPTKTNIGTYYEKVAQKFGGRYFQGYITSFEKTSTAGDHVEIQIEYGANGVGAAGDVTVTAAQQEQAAYVFADSTQVSQGG